MRCFPHNIMCKILRFIVRITAKTLTVALLMIILYGVYYYTDTLDGRSKCDRCLETQESIPQHERKIEVDRKAVSQVHMATHHGISESTDSLKDTVVDRKETEIIQTNSPVGSVHHSDRPHGKPQTEHDNRATPIPTENLTRLVVGNSHATNRFTRVRTPELSQTVLLNKHQLLSRQQSSSVAPQKLSHPISMNSKTKTRGLHNTHGNTATIPPIPFMGNYNCRDKQCREFLSKLDELCYKYCYERLLRRHEKEPDLVPLEPGRCHFMNATSRAAVALVSFPGSGNTWVRGLLEQATGICTGAVYCDYGIRSAGFNGEGIRTGSVIAIKTHKREPQWTGVNVPDNSNLKSAPSYGAAILLIRNPLNALVAEWNRDVSKKVTYDPTQNGSSIHVKYVGQEYFGKNPQWNSFVMRKIRDWQQYFIGWIVNGRGHPVLVVRYEDLKTDKIGQVKRMLDFLRVPYSEDELQKRMEADLGTFRRKHHGEFEHFTSKQRDYVRQKIAETLDYLKKRNYEDTLGVTEYLDSQ